MLSVQFFNSDSKNHKYKATFYRDGDKIKTIHFGAKGYEDYTTHNDSKRKANYIARHRRNENWDNPLSAGTLSRYILWNKKNIFDSIKDYLKRFSISLIKMNRYN